MVSTVSARMLPAETGKTFPGSPNAQSVLIPAFFAAAKSTPPGFEARSIRRASFLTCERTSAFITGFGTVLNIKEHFPITSPMRSVFIGLQPFVSAKIRSSLLRAEASNLHTDAQSKRHNTFPFDHSRRQAPSGPHSVTGFSRSAISKAASAVGTAFAV